MIVCRQPPCLGLLPGRDDRKGGHVLMCLIAGVNRYPIERWEYQTECSCNRDLVLQALDGQ